MYMTVHIQMYMLMKMTAVHIPQGKSSQIEYSYPIIPQCAPSIPYLFLLHYFSRNTTKPTGEALFRCVIHCLHLVTEDTMCANICLCRQLLSVSVTCNEATLRVSIFCQFLQISEASGQPSSTLSHTTTTLMIVGVSLRFLSN